MKIMEIKKVEAYKIYDKLFETIEEANDYKYQKLDNVRFLEGNCPHDGIMSGNIKYSCTKLEIENKIYSWKIMNRHRKDLWRRLLPFLADSRYC